MKILIFGATGLLGQALMKVRTEDEVKGLGSNVDIRDAGRVSAAVAEFKPDWVVLAAAYTDVDGCETNRELAFEVNTQGAEKVALAAKEQGARLLFLSTDYVFDGRKTAPYKTDGVRSPRTVYGQSKAVGEMALEAILPDCCIVRTSWLFGVGGKCFPETILKLTAQQPVLEVVDDQRGSPTYTRDLAGAIMELCRKNARGIVHATNSGDCTWFDLAQEIVAEAGLTCEVRSTTSEKFVRAAERPKYSVLCGESLRRYGIHMPDWRDGLRRYLEERRASLS